MAEGVGVVIKVVNDDGIGTDPGGLLMVKALF